MSTTTTASNDPVPPPSPPPLPQPDDQFSDQNLPPPPPMIAIEKEDISPPEEFRNNEAANDLNRRSFSGETTSNSTNKKPGQENHYASVAVQPRRPGPQPAPNADNTTDDTLRTAALPSKVEDMRARSRSPYSRHLMRNGSANSVASTVSLIFHFLKSMKSVFVIVTGRTVFIFMEFHPR
jgi:hypothetical protein